MNVTNWNLAPGSARPELARAAQHAWLQAATAAGIDVTDFDPDAPTEKQIEWARRKGLRIGGAVSRFSTTEQESAEAQTCESARGAATRKFFVPAAYLCVDEGVSGKKNRRPGLEKLRSLLKEKLLEGVFTFKISRLFRSGYRGYAFVHDELISKGVRCVAVGEGIDSGDDGARKRFA